MHDKIMEILDKLQFFGGQRAGRELWADKLTDVQDADIEAFNENVDTIRGYIQTLEATVQRQQKDNGLLEEAIDKIAPLIPRWIPVEERLPERWRAKDKDRTLINYLVYMPEYGVDVGNWVKDAKMWVVMGLPTKVTHWMPLPEPPTKGE